MNPQMIFLTIALLGVQILWTVELGYGTPYLLSLGLSKAQSTLIWLAGPLSGLIIQPLIGKWSDHGSRWGRRKPFLLGSMLLTLLALVMISTPTIFTDDFRIAFVVTGFYLLDAGLNGVQAMARALIVDCLPIELQNSGHAAASWMIALGNALGYGVGSTDLEWVFRQRLTQFQGLTLVTGCLFTLCISLTLIKTKEPRQMRQTTHPNCFTVLRELPTDIIRLFISQFFAYFAWFPILFYSSQYVQDHAFAFRAELISSGSLLLFSVLCTITSAIAPRLKGQLKNILACSHLGTACSMIVLTSVTSYFNFGLAGAISIVAFNGILCAFLFWIPFSLIGEYLHENERDILDPETGKPPRRDRDKLPAGVVLGVHNVFIVLPQFFSSLVCGAVFQLFPDDSIAWSWRVCGIGALLSAWFASKMKPRTH